MRRGPNEHNRENLLLQISGYYLQGRTQHEIGTLVGLSQSQVSRNLKTLQRRWRDAAVRNVDDRKAEELAKIDALEREYWAAWERSKTEKTTTRAAKRDMAIPPGPHGNPRVGTVTEASRTEEESIGDPRYLAGVQWCITKRCDILGLDAPVKADIHGHQTVHGTIVRMDVTKEDLELMTPNALAEYWQRIRDADG
jgi:hypothetical protein